MVLWESRPHVRLSEALVAKNAPDLSQSASLNRASDCIGTEFPTTEVQDKDKG